MLTVKEVCKITGVSARTLRYYDSIGLLKPAEVTYAGYRLYNDESIARLGQILLFKDLQFGLSDIKKILDNPDFDKEKVLDNQLELLILKKNRLENIISAVEKIKRTGVYEMDFDVFNSEKIKEYSAQAKKQWGNTGAYREYSEKTADYSDKKQNELAENMMCIFKDIGKMTDKSPEDPDVQKQIKRLQNFISENYYTCTDVILSGLGQIYASGGEMTENIDAVSGKGTAVFTAKAITEYCKLASV